MATQKLQPRPPIVTIMGHVDHGKTTLLDYLRKSSVAAGEAGGITQHIGAFVVDLKCGNKITFLDTPGHAAFSSIRSRGAQVTDIVVLVVAADDGIMPQTIESIEMAKKAQVPIIVAINKCDKFEANAPNIKRQLMNHGITIEEFGGDVACVLVSGLSGRNIDQLEEAIIAQSEYMDLKADPDGIAQGIIIETKQYPGLGPVATGLIQNGTLKLGDLLLSDRSLCKVRRLTNFKGENVPSASPSTPVEISGWKDEPEIGVEFHVIQDEKSARTIVDYRRDLFEKSLEDLEQNALLNNKVLNEQLRAEIRDHWLHNPDKVAPNIMELKKQSSKPALNVFVKCIEKLI